MVEKKVQAQFMARMPAGKEGAIDGKNEFTHLPSIVSSKCLTVFSPMKRSID